MSKAIQGAGLLLGAVGLGVAAFLDPALVASPLFDKFWASLIIGGLSMEAGAIADALTSNRGSNITLRQPASFRQIIVGNQRVGGIIIYASTTGSHHDQYNRVIVIAGHVCHSLLNLYLDGRRVYWDTSSFGNTTRNGVNFGGHADGNDHIGPDGNHYNFGGLVFCEARFGDQLPGDVMGSLTANDPNWAAGPNGSPYVGGCTYVYLKVEDDASMFPGEPEIRFDVNGKCDIYDPRTQTTGFTSNWALVVCDRMTDSKLGLGLDYATEINEAQLIAAANVCDEQVPLAAGGTESRYSCHWHGDTSTGPADVISAMMSAAAGRLSRIGGEWYIWPAYWQGPSFNFDQRVLVGDTLQWRPYRSLTERFNRVTGTYTAPNYPYNAAGNLYDANGWYDGTIQNTFGFGYQNTNYPQFAMDTEHGYPNDQWLLADGGNPLPKEIGMPCTLSIAQSQRVAKIYLMRNRYEGTGSMTVNLSAWGMQPCDVMTFTFPEYLGWHNKILEVSGTGFHIEERETEGGRGIAVFITLQVNETDPDVYEWNPTAGDEQTVYAVPAGLQQTPNLVTPPTGLVLTSVTSTGQNPGIGGNSTNYAIRSTWVQAADVLVTLIQLQAKRHTDTVWLDAGSASALSTQADIFGVNQGSAYDVRIRSVRSNGAASNWVEVDNYTV